MNDQAARTFLIAGNWKMNGTSSLVDEMLSALQKGAQSTAADIVICPPFTLLSAAHSKLSTSAIALGAQDCHAHTSGAHTGDISAAMLKEAGCGWVIVGHSERRQHHSETNELVAAKTAQAHSTGLKTIVCVGETLEEREAGTHLSLISAQLSASLPASANAQNTVIAYEPVWAIGTGKVASTGEVAEVHAHIHAHLEQHTPSLAANARVLYGGSVKPGNASEILNTPNVGGLLVGGASLNVEDFLSIIAAAGGSDD